MHTIGDILELLKASKETLDQILEACGWSDLEEFTDEQAETLIAVNGGHEEHNWSYLESYLRMVAHQHELAPETYDEIAEAISQAGGTLLDYREQFKTFCLKVKIGVSPSDAVMPPKDAPITSPDPFSNCQDEELLDFINKQAEAAATTTLSRIQGFADKAAEEQERLEQAFLLRYRQFLAQKLLDPEFEAQFTLRMQRSLEKGAKKQTENERLGVQTPTALLSSTN